jgi:hypothetical protein
MSVRIREREAALRLAQYLKSLRTISWSSLFARGGVADNDRIWQTTFLGVTRKDGRIRVNTIPA